MKIVLDTNVLVSGIFFSGPPYQILEAWRDNKIQIVISPEILDEYQRVGKELSKQFTEVKLTPILELITTKAEIILAPGLPERLCKDPNDDKFIACAISGRAKLIISGDKHLLNVSSYQGIKIVRPKQFINEYLSKSEKHRGR